MQRWAAMIVLAGSLWSHPAVAACSKDTDCKGERVCEDGICVEAPRRPARPSRERSRPHTEPVAEAETDKFWSVDGSLALGIREGAGAKPAVPGAGVVLGFEYGRFMALAEFLAPWSFRNTLSGVGVGAGAVFPLADGVDFLLVGMVGLWETIATNGTYTDKFGLAWERQFRTHDYLIAYPHLRFGDHLHVTIGPRIALGDYETLGDSEYGGKSVTFTLSSQVGWRF